jgi:hypothetical protein
MNLTIKSLKTWIAREGYGYQYNLYEDGKKIAFVNNDGNGGQMDIDFADGKRRGWGSPIEARINAYIATLEAYFYGGKFNEHNIETFLDEVLEAYESNKALVKAKKKGITFRLADDALSVIRTIITFDLEKAKNILDSTYKVGGYEFI